MTLLPMGSSPKSLCAAALIAASTAAIAAVALAFGWHRYVPILGYWEHLHFFYSFGPVTPHLSFAIAPRANIGGQGYPLLDLGLNLTNALGWSLANFRIVIFAYSLGTYAAMALVFSRWFGVPAALFGVTLAVLSTGYLVFTNQALVMLPTLFLCVLLVERFQKLDETPNATGPKVMIAILIALLMIHYGMGRFFAVGWMLFYFAQRIYLAWRHLPGGRPFRDYLKQDLITAISIVSLALVLICLVDFRNILAFRDPWNIFFPRYGTEVEMVPDKLFPTIIGNIPLLLEMLFPFLHLSGERAVGIEALLSGQRTAILNLWHAPFLIIGIGVSIRRSFRTISPMVTPYLALHVLFLLTVGLTVFSQQYGASATISPYRIFCGMFAVAGYIAVAFLWITETIRAHVPNLGRWAMLPVAGLLFAVASVSLTAQADDLRMAIAAKAHIDGGTGEFATAPDTLTYGDDIDTYRQARFKFLANTLSSALACGPRQSAVLLRLSPELLFVQGKYRGVHYLQTLNDLSATMALYMGDHGLNAAHVIVHTRDTRGIRDRGHGYGGRSRVFSGPIYWADNKIVYSADEPLAYELVEARPGRKPMVIVAFSDAEVVGAKASLDANGIQFSFTGPVSSIRQLGKMATDLRAPCPAATNDPELSPETLEKRP